jgi:hypothetical protein
MANPAPRSKDKATRAIMKTVEGEGRQLFPTDVISSQAQVDIARNDVVIVPDESMRMRCVTVVLNRPTS